MIYRYIFRVLKTAVTVSAFFVLKKCHTTQKLGLKKNVTLLGFILYHLYYSFAIWLQVKTEMSTISVEFLYVKHNFELIIQK